MLRGANNKRTRGARDDEEAEKKARMEGRTDEDDDDDDGNDDDDDDAYEDDLSKALAGEQLAIMDAEEYKTWMVEEVRNAFTDAMRSKSFRQLVSKSVIDALGAPDAQNLIVKAIKSEIGEIGKTCDDLSKTVDDFVADVAERFDGLATSAETLAKSVGGGTGHASDENGKQATDGKKQADDTELAKSLDAAGQNLEPNGSAPPANAKAGELVKKAIVLRDRHKINVPHLANALTELRVGPLSDVTFGELSKSVLEIEGAHKA